MIIEKAFQMKGLPGQTQIQNTKYKIKKFKIQNKKANLCEGRIARADSTADPRLLPRLTGTFRIFVAMIMFVDDDHDGDMMMMMMMTTCC